MHIASFEDVHKVYPVKKGRIHAVRGVTLNCRKGEILAVLGPSGSGKSSLMRYDFRSGASQRGTYQNCR